MVCTCAFSKAARYRLVLSTKFKFTNMTAPLVVRLESELLTTIDSVDRALLSVKIACYHARTGEFESAESRRVALRKEFGTGQNARVSIMLMCLEGLLLYFKDLDPAARDRVLRANVLSIACGERSLIALTSAWLSHIDFNQGRYESMARALYKCFESIDADDGTASSRASLVLGDAFTFTSDIDHAKAWYEHARVTANRMGDQATVGALTYNRAALHIASARIRRLTTPLDSAEVRFISAEVRSAINYQYVARLISLDHLLRSSSIGVLMLEDQFEQACVAIDQLVSLSEVPKGSAELALLYADQAHCLARLGRVSEATAAAQAATAIATDGFDADDRAVICGALCDYNSTSGQVSSATTWRRACQTALSEHQKTIESLTILLTPFLSGPQDPLRRP